MRNAGSGTLDGERFEKSDFTITALGDTDERQKISAGWFIDHQSASIRIDGVGEFDIFTGTRDFVNQRATIVGFSRAGVDGADLLNGPTDGQFASWDMLDPIGPISGPGRLFPWSGDPKIVTSGGILIFDGGRIEVTFIATAQPPCDPCDANCDGSVNPADVEPFVELLLGGKPCGECTGDTNNDGSVDLLDVEGFIGCLSE